MIVKLSSDAEADIRDGYWFYERQTSGLGGYFRDCIIADIESLAFYGGIHGESFGHHRMLAKRFPFAIYYDVEGEVATVVAVLVFVLESDAARRCCDASRLALDGDCSCLMSPMRRPTITSTAALSTSTRCAVDRCVVLVNVPIPAQGGDYADRAWGSISTRSASNPSERTSSISDRTASSNEPDSRWMPLRCSKGRRVAIDAMQGESRVLE